MASSDSAYGMPATGMQPAPSQGNAQPNAFSAPAPAAPQPGAANGAQSTGGARGALNSAYTSAAQKVKNTGTATIVKVMRGANLINGILLVIMGITALTNCTYDKWSGYILGFHAIAFGLLLACFELRVGDRINRFVDGNFGFLFNSTGRTLFLVFLATFPFSMMGGENCSELLPILTGVITVCNAIFNCIVIYNHPGFQKNGVVTQLEKDRQNAAAAGVSTAATSAFVDDIEIGTGATNQFDTEEQKRGVVNQSAYSTNDNENPFEQQSEYAQPTSSYVPPVQSAPPSSYSMDVPVPAQPAVADAVENSFEPNDGANQDLQASSALAEDNPFEKSADDNPFADQSVRDVI